MGDVPADLHGPGAARHARGRRGRARTPRARPLPRPGIGPGAAGRGPERAAGAAAAGPPPPANRQRRRARRRSGGDRHARRDRPPRRAADRPRLRPDAAQGGVGTQPGADGARQTLAAAVVDRAGRARGCAPQRAEQAPCSRRRGPGRRRGGNRADRRHVAQPDGGGRQRQPVGRGRGRRARGAARSRAARGAAGAARLVRRRGDAAGRHPRVRRAPSRRPAARAHDLREPRHGRLAPPDPGRGGGAVLDGALHRAVAERPGGRRRRAAGDRRSSADSLRALPPTP